MVADFVGGMIHEWTGRLDCTLHMRLLLWLTHDLRAVGLITSHMGYQGMVLINDGVLSYTFSKRQSADTRATLAGELCKAVIERYKRLRLKVAIHQFHFLNRHFAEGSEILCLSGPS